MVTWIIIFVWVTISTFIAAAHIRQKKLEALVILIKNAKTDHNYKLKIASIVNGIKRGWKNEALIEIEKSYLEVSWLFIWVACLFAPLLVIAILVTERPKFKDFKGMLKELFNFGIKRPLKNIYISKRTAGNLNRRVMRVGDIYHIGCGRFTSEEAIEKINLKYKDTEAANYIAALNEMESLEEIYQQLFL